MRNTFLLVSLAFFTTTLFAQSTPSVEELLRTLGGTDGAARDKAALALKEMRAQGYVAVREAAKRAKQGEFFDRLEALKREMNGPALVASLIKDLDNDQYAVRRKAEEALDAIGTEAVPAMKKALTNDPTLDARRRLEKLIDIIRFREGDAELDKKIAKLIEDLDDNMFPVREKASQELTNIGVYTVRALRQAIKTSQSLEVRHRARRILEALGAPED